MKKIITNNGSKPTTMINYNRFPVVLLLICIFIFTQSVKPQITQPGGVTTEIIKTAGVTDASQITTLSSANRLTIQKYVDGFGRPLQKILVGASPDNGKDIIQFYKYDEFGRQTQQYLPFAYAAASSPYQSQSTAITNQASFYGTSGAKVATDTKPWIKAEIEQSPMQRLLKQGNAGDGFQTDQHYKTITYRTNNSTADGSIRKWAPDGTSSGSYSDNDLGVKEGADENGNKSFAFTDKVGRIVLKRRQADETIAGTLYPYFDTYYIYDLAGNLSYIVPPKAIAKLTSIGGTWNVTNVPNLTYHYTYDAKNRAIIKKVPNAANTYIVYDPLDRPVLVQDGNMRANNKWYYTKYDSEDRTIIQGIYTDATHTTFNDGNSSTDIQIYVNGLSCYGSSSTTYYELRTTGTSSWYTNNCFPTANYPSGSLDERIYCYYDDYDFDNSGSADYSYATQSMTGEQGAVDKTLGLPTGLKKKILGTSNWLVSYTFYDKWYHPIQTISNNELKLTTVSDLSTQIIDIAGRITATRKYKSHSQGSGFSITVNNSYTYDKMNRLLEVKQINNSEAEVIVGHYEYNALGQLVDKKLHSTNSGSSYLQSVDLRYNLRGQLTSINNSALANDGGTTNDETNDLFGMNLVYEISDGINTPVYTGVVTRVAWKANPPSGGNTDARSYAFTYDKLNRLKTASYVALAGGGSGFSSWTKDPGGFDECITYDWNGNIMMLRRNAMVTGYSGRQLIDSLSYTYAGSNDNNQLQSVTENSTNANAGLGFSSLSSSSYVYDDNGNLITDPKKGTTITYNELNKPVQITNGTGTMTYEYDASGICVRKTTVFGRTTQNIYYVDGFVFFKSNYSLSYFQMPEGRVRPGTTNYVYEYFVTDQQGNVRISFEDNGSGTAVVRQENSFYPFGMTMPGEYLSTAPNKNLYNAGSEWQDDYFGIANYYSTFFREYDPILGRFNSVDPKAEATDELSIYHYAGNNPVNFNDPMGDIMHVPTSFYGDYFEEYMAGGYMDHFTGDGGGLFSLENGGGLGGSTELRGVIKVLLNSPFGGAWSATAGFSFYGSDITAIRIGGLAIIGTQTAIDLFISIATDAMGGVKTIQVANNGKATLLQLTKQTMTPQQEAFYNVLSDAADETKPLITIQVVEGSEYVIFGSYGLQQIDVTDINRTGKLAPGILAHEIYEQTIKQRSGDVNNENFAFNHFSAILWAEDPVNGYKRSLLDLNKKTYLRTVETNSLRFPNGKWSPVEIQSGSAFFNYTVGNQSFEFGFMIQRGNIVMPF